MADLGQGKLVDGTIDEDYRSAAPPELVLNVAATNNLLGTNLDRDRMAALLKSIEFDVQTDGETDLWVRVPSFRVDVSRPQDLMEEVARLSGYNQIPTTFPALPAQGVTPSPMMALRNQIRDIFSGFGFSETINYSFIGADACDRLQLDADDPRRRHVVLLNPISEDLAVMRTSLMPGLLESVQRNSSRQQTALRLFEIGKVFLPHPGELLPEEKEMLVGCWTGAAEKGAWYAKERNCDFFDIKGVVEGLMLVLGIDALSYMALPDDQCRIFRAGHAAQIFHEAQVLGHVGELNPTVVEAFGLKLPVFAFELNIQRLAGVLPGIRQMAPIPRFPSTARDITVIVDQDVETARLVETMARFKEELVENVYLFDVFAGEPIPAGKKSASFRVIYRSAERTLDDETVNTIHQQITYRLVNEVGAALPA
jgi:phenylalanyl-tRNA synthetase beta chain